MVVRVAKGTGDHGFLTLYASVLITLYLYSFDKNKMKQNRVLPLIPQ